jgi:GNAT superfamily N-acetyltransferase
MVLVDPSSRRQGIGMKLLKESLNILRKENTVKLDATPAGREVYLKLDFRDEYYLSRMHCRSVAAQPKMKSHVRKTQPTDLYKIYLYDQEVFGANRENILEWMLKGSPELCFVVRKSRKNRRLLFWTTR